MSRIIPPSVEVLIMNGEIKILFDDKRFSFEIIIDGKLYLEPRSGDEVVIPIEDSFNLKIRALEYKYGKLVYSSLLTDMDVSPEDESTIITVGSGIVKIKKSCMIDEK